MTLIFDKNAWHYRLILWIFGEHFFDDAKIDWPKVESINGDDLKKIGWNGLPRKYTPKTVNFCPYCRAVVGSAISAPFLYIWRLFPHKPKPRRNRQQMLKRMRIQSWIIRIIAASLDIGFGIKNLFGGEIIGALIQFAVAAFVLTGQIWIPPIFKWIAKNTAMKPRKIKVKKPKQTSKIVKKIEEKHDVICPPIFFIDKTSNEEYK